MAETSDQLTEEDETAAALLVNSTSLAENNGNVKSHQGEILNAHRDDQNFETR